MILNSYQVKIDFEPWFSSASAHYFDLVYLHIHEEIGGKMATGEMDMSYGTGEKSGDPSFDMIQNEVKGTLVIEDMVNGIIRTIPVFIMKKDFSVESNILHIEFICGVDSGDFITKRKNSVYTGNLKSVISGLYPGSSDFRDVESDIQDTSLKYYQNNETDYEVATRLAYSYKHQSIFSFGWEGFMLKEAYGNKNSFGQPDPGSPELTLRSTSPNEVLDNDQRKYDINLYTFPYNPWEDTSGEKEISDYTEFEPMNLRVQKKYGDRQYIQTPYLPLLENSRYNRMYQDSDYFTNFRVKLNYMPKYKIGDVIVYENTKNLITANNVKLPYKYFIVRANEFFISTGKSNVRDPFGGLFSWVTKLSGIEATGAIALGNEEDKGGIVI